jgi:hypothetical protein
MEEVLRELTELELAAVAGGNPFSQNNSSVSVTGPTQNYANNNIGQIGIDVTALAAAVAVSNG